MPSAGNPQTLNRYAYTLNNPVTHTDPTGHVVPLLAVAAGALLGLAVGVAGYYLGNAATNMAADRFPGQFQHHEAKAEEAIIAGVVGMAAGATLPLMVTTAGAVALGGVANVVQYGATQLYNGKPIDATAVLLSAGTGSLAGWMGGTISSKTLFEMSNPYPSAAGYEIQSQARWTFANEQLQQLPRSFFGATVSNADFSGVGGSDKGGDATYSGLGLPDAAAPQINDSTDGALSAFLSGEASLSIPAGIAPGGVGIVNITVTDPSGQPEDGRGWDAQDREAREAAWMRGGAPDYNALREAGVPGYC